MKLGMIGLGRMGGNMTVRLGRDGHEVMTYDPKVESTAESIEELVGQLEPPRALWMMVPSGEITERTFGELLEAVFETLAPPQGWAHVGAAGSGHFVKMVHNGIEYGLMQAYAEGFELMYHSEYNLDLLEIAGIWRYGSVVRSWLLELLHGAFEEHGSALEDIAGYVEDSGEGRWTINEAINAAVPVPALASSLFSRFASRQEINFGAKVAAALRNQFGGHAVRAIEKAMARSDDSRG